MKNLKRSALGLSFLIALLCLQSCSKYKVWKGSGALYIAERGQIKCVNVKSVTFVSHRVTLYSVGDLQFDTQAALDFYEGEKCSE